ncbi:MULTISPECIES: N-6 DNA methylase [Rhizobium]|uniref:N-6 DNA methylase n=1 Tax=Rhizobium TaxID=379 RepID=UPI001C83375C|nr:MULTISPECIES: N-6 DNA methylase [unclassified Rhizobium]MBX4924685.1 N-6 DNA methylase [Rhizobium binae]MBX5213424.1 N-6 DNA methylase [Rhizobium sp. NLR9a]MBX5230940.1 N-6 DNA methylase [Rhizobium sp. NLR4a]MBX5243690.1 N-6 DNA methylase [Rhizobium sp. NLR3b]MBX5267326.1 N-6 DNA methylase [Rhizobium sp. NLR17b]
MQTIAAADVTSIIDLGAGSGTLSDAAIRHWMDISVTTIDIDASCEVAMRYQDSSGSHTHYTLDALDPDITLKVSKAGFFDAALCNPPFRRIEWNDRYNRVLREAGLDQCFSSKGGNVAAEALFLAQNVRLVRPGGSIGLIVSDSFISGRAAAPLRKRIVQHHSIRAVVQLPKRAFSGTEANSFLLVLTNKVASSEMISLYKFSLDEGLSDAIVVDQHSAERRLDYDFHSIIRMNSNDTPLGSLGATINRGNISSVQLKIAPEFIFHTTDFGKWKSGEIHGPTLAQCHAQIGDILVARVDRALETKVAIVRRGSFQVSDCVFIIRVPSQHKERVFTALRTKEGQEKLKSLSRGVGARHISKTELLAFPIPEA